VEEAARRLLCTNTLTILSQPDFTWNVFSRTPAAFCIGSGAESPQDEIRYPEQLLSSEVVQNTIFLAIRCDSRRYMEALNVETATPCGLLFTF
jgi:hypothetical protein